MPWAVPSWREGPQGRCGQHLSKHTAGQRTGQCSARQIPQMHPAWLPPNSRLVDALFPILTLTFHPSGLRWDAAFFRALSLTPSEGDTCPTPQGSQGTLCLPYHGLPLSAVSTASCLVHLPCYSRSSWGLTESALFTVSSSALVTPPGTSQPLSKSWMDRYTETEGRREGARKRQRSKICNTLFSWWGIISY